MTEYEQKSLEALAQIQETLDEIRKGVVWFLARAKAGEEMQQRAAEISRNLRR